MGVQRYPDWPFAMTKEMALDFTRVAPGELRRWAKEGKVQFLPRGPNGALITLRSQLEAALADMFAGAADVSEDFDFGDD